MTPEETYFKLHSLQRKYKQVTDHVAEILTLLPNAAGQYADEENRQLYKRINWLGKMLGIDFIAPAAFGEFKTTSLRHAEDKMYEVLGSQGGTPTPGNHPDILPIMEKEPEEKSQDVCQEPENRNENRTTGHRSNSGKMKLSLVLEARKALEGAAAVMMFGEQKYARSNWKNGLDLNECMDSLMRHATKYMDGEYLDLNPDTGRADVNYSGLPHLDHLLVNALFLSHHTNRKTGDGKNTDTGRPLTTEELFEALRPEKSTCGAGCIGCEEESW